MKLLLTIFLFFTVAADAQITSSVYSGARYQPAGGARGVTMTLPGCSTTTTITPDPSIELIFRYTSFPWYSRTDTVYDDRRLESADPKTFQGFFLSATDVPIQFIQSYTGYFSFFLDQNNDGTYETMDGDSPYLMIRSANDTWTFYPSGWSIPANRNVRCIISKSPTTNSCPSDMIGMVVDAYVPTNEL